MRRLAFLLIFFWFASPLLHAAESPVYSWSVVPQFRPLWVHTHWKPLLEKLEKRTGYRFRLITADSFNFFEGGLYKGKFDFAYANPYQTLLAHRLQGYIPLLRDNQQKLRGILVVRKDSPIRSVKDLNGKKIAFASPNAFAVSLYMRAYLREKKGIDLEPVWTGSHSNAYRQVLLGRADASGGIYRTFDKEPASVRKLLRVIDELPETVTHAVVAHPRLPKEVRDKVREALIDMARWPEERQLLAEVFLPKPVAADFKRDYAPLEQLKLEDYVVMPE